MSRIVKVRLAGDDHDVTELAELLAVWFAVSDLSRPYANHRDAGVRRYYDIELGVGPHPVAAPSAKDSGVAQ